MNTQENKYYLYLDGEHRGLVSTNMVVESYGRYITISKHEYFKINNALSNMLLKEIDFKSLPFFKRLAKIHNHFSEMRTLALKTREESEKVIKNRGIVGVN